MREAQNWLNQYQIAVQNIKGLSHSEQTEYIASQIDELNGVLREVEQIITLLPLSQKRTVLQLHYISGMTFSKIGTKLLIAPSTVQNYHAAGLERVYEILTKRGKL